MIKKNAFTIIESIIVLMIIGVISTFALAVVKSDKNKYGPLYYTAYEVLRKANYSVYADPNCPYLPNDHSDIVNDSNTINEINDSIGSNAVPCCGANGCRPRAYPVNSFQLCERLSEFIPHVQNANGKNCGLNSTSSTGIEALDIDDLANDFDNLNSTNDNFIDNKIRLITTNSMRIYISKRHSFGSGSDALFHYFIVYVDLNGKKNPNSVYPVCSMARDTDCFNSGFENDIKNGGTREKGDDIYSGFGYLPDIVAFILTSTGEIVPIGYPAFTTNYLAAKVKFPEYANIDGNYAKLALVDQFSESMSFVQAKHRAWGKTSSTDVIQSIDFHKELFAPKQINEYRHPSGKTCTRYALKQIIKKKAKAICPSNNKSIECNTTLSRTKSGNKYIARCSKPANSLYCTSNLKIQDAVKANEYCCTDSGKANLCTETAKEWTLDSNEDKQISKLVSFFYSQSEFNGDFLSPDGWFENKAIYPDIFDLDEPVTKDGHTIRYNCQEGTYNCRVDIEPYTTSR